MILKFRAWHKELKIMSEVLSVNLYERLYVNVMPQEAMAGKEIPLWLDTEIELMQWTGLQDDNGVDIYEGDILEFDWNCSGSENYAPTREAVKFSGGQFEPLPNPQVKGSLIIGHIYENQELLEKK